MRRLPRDGASGHDVRELREEAAGPWQVPAEGVEGRAGTGSMRDGMAGQGGARRKGGEDGDTWLCGHEVGWLGPLRSRGLCAVCYK